MRFSAWIAACCIGMGLGASADASQTWTFRTGLAFSDKNADRHCEGNDVGYSFNGSLLVVR